MIALPKKGVTHRCHDYRRLTVFVIAHPDDESMFFVPTIHHIVQQQQKSKRSIRQRQQQQDDDSDSDSRSWGGGGVWLVCLTSGNYNGLGKIRSQELYRTCKDILGIDKVILMNEGEQEQQGVFFDHPRQSWNVEQATQCLFQTLQEALQEEKQQQQQHQQQIVKVIDFITFDELGVSGHINHRDTYRTVKSLCENQQQQQHFQNEINFPRCNGWTLKTEQNIISKYLPLYSWILLSLSILCSFFFLFAKSEQPQSRQYGNDSDDDVGDSSVRIVYRLHQPWINWTAMRSHASQFVWYRRLFVIFSSYTYVNVLNRLGTIVSHPQPQSQEQQDEKRKSQ